MLRPIALATALAAASTAAHAAPQFNPPSGLTVTLDTDAFNLAAALAPTPGLLNSVTGVSVDAPVSTTGGAVGTFIGAYPTLRFDSGVVLSTGNAAEITTGPFTTSGQDFGSTPLADTAALLAQIPGGGSGFFDAARLSLSIDPGLESQYINFHLAFGTNEAGVTTDRVGVFVNGVYHWLKANEPFDQSHPWAAPAGSGFGFATNLYPGGDVLDYPSLMLSILIEQPGSPLTLDFLVADVTDGATDTAILIGGLNGSLAPTGNLLQPIPVPAAVWLFASGLAGLTLSRRRKA
jgi:hypothetical protein